MIDYREFFRTATGYQPYDYQCRLACGERDSSESEAQWASMGAPCGSHLINIPTGLGKTAAVVLAWFWNRFRGEDCELQRAPWPRRLAYCLPMRTLVEQTRDNVEVWLLRLALAATIEGSEERQIIEKRLSALDPDRQKALWDEDSDGNRRWHATGALNSQLPASAVSALLLLAEHSPIVLMGGEEDGPPKADWDLWPERPAILIGTQDMLLSRALNRGYGMSRYRWPMHFGLLNNDCLWVFDEVQLMGIGLATTAQLEAFRNRFGRNGCASVWMSATLQKSWLKTVDFTDPEALPLRQLDHEDLRNHQVRQRREARKRVRPARARMDDPNGLAEEILQTHQHVWGRTLAVVNTVKRARALFQQLQRLTKFTTLKPDLILIHSRFRPDDRRKQVDRLLAKPGEQGMIVVSTQVLEAGVDVSATTVFTELAPWASLVQRFGRCNRGGAENNSQVFWIDLPVDDRQHDKFSAPYPAADLLRSRELLEGCTDVGPASLEEVNATLPYQHGHVLRFKDLDELFDTTPDLAGNDIDIERYVREVEECDVQVFWRKWLAGSPPSADMRGARREELCSAPVSEFRELANDSQRRKLAYRWDYLDDMWRPIESERICPGQIYLLHASAGGYTPVTGWDMSSLTSVLVLPGPVSATPDANDADRLSQLDWQSIGAHTDRACCELEFILSKLFIGEAAALRMAARWHDRGKAHPSFLAKLKPEEVAKANAANLLVGGYVAKAPETAWVKGTNRNEHYRRHFRHELVSGLAVLMARDDKVSADLRDLVAYLAAAHHGKVRLSIRSLPDEVIPPDDRRFARGVWEGDQLPETDLGGEVIAAAVELSLEPMQLGLCEQPPFEGQPSWADRMLRLRDNLGPFRLAHLEAILRAADMRASRATQPTEATNV